VTGPSQVKPDVLQPVDVDGGLQTRLWDDDAGKWQWRTEVRILAESP
jgi:hypothetical protein